MRRWMRCSGAVLCLAGGAGLVHQSLQAPGVFQGQVNVVFLMPTASADNALTARPAVLANFAGIVARSVAGRGGGDITVSDDVTLAGQGVRDGWSVRQPNSGGQWNYSFDQPVVAIQATGPSAASVTVRLDSALTRIREDIARRESEAGTSPEQSVRLALSPSEPIVLYADGDRRRAALAGLVASAAAAVAVLRWPTRVRE